MNRDEWSVFIGCELLLDQKISKLNDDDDAPAQHFITVLTVF